MADIAKIRLGSTDYDIKDEAARTEINNFIENYPVLDIHTRIKLTKWKTFPFAANDSNRMYQGMATDGTYLYLASVSTGDNTLMSVPRIKKIEIATGAVIAEKTLPDKGHLNNLCYYNGYLYCTGFNANDVKDDYSQIYRYNFETNTGTRINTPEWYWDFQIGTRANGVKFTVGHVASRPMMEIYTTMAANSGDFYPWTWSPLDYYNGIEQGAALYDNKFICTLYGDARVVGTNVNSADEIRVVNLAGVVVKRISLDRDEVTELEDICFIGNKLYVNDRHGNVYTYENIDTIFRNWYDNTDVASWTRPCYLYHNTNGSETYFEGTWGGTTGHLLKSFRLMPMTNLYNFGDAIGYFNTRSHIFPFKLNPVTGDITVSCAFTSGNYSYDLLLYYKRDSDADNYYYTLKSIVGGFRDSSGTLTKINASTDAEITSVCNDVFYDGYSFIHSIVASTTLKYRYNPINY